MLRIDLLQSFAANSSHAGCRRDENVIQSSREGKSKGATEGRTCFSGQSFEEAVRRNVVPVRPVKQLG